jgi:glycosyltransferase involved in cell wall biosynthesis
MKIACVSLGSEYDVRFHKVAATLIRHNHDVTFIGVNRNPNGQFPASPLPIRTAMLRRQLPHGPALAFHLPGILSHLVRSVRREQPDVLYCVNEEVAFFMALASRRPQYRTHIICDIYDSLGLRTSGSLIHPPARVVTALAHRWADALIVTDENRLTLIPERYRFKTAVLPNYPVYSSRRLPDVRPSGKIKILVAGALAPTRGLPELLAACERVPDVEIWCAGEPVSQYVDEVFLRNPRVSYRGVLAHDDVIALALECDAIFAFYAPTNLNNINASPNKIFDGLLAGRPVLVNSEVKVSRFVEDNCCGFVCPHGDADALANIIRSLLGQRDTLPAYEQRVRALGARAYSWEVVEGVLEKVLSNHRPRPQTDPAP